MNVAFLKALVALVPACLLFYGSMVLFLREKTAPCVLQVVGAGGLVGRLYSCLRSAAVVALDGLGT